MKINKLIFLLFNIIFLLSAATAKTQISISKFENPIKIDGYLSEDVWKTATKITDFYSFLPVDGLPAEDRTAVLMGYDSKNIYLAFICFYDQPSRVRANITKRDEIFDDDHVAFLLDTYNSGKNAYQFYFNPYGIQADGIYTEYVGEDNKPDFIFQSKGRLFGQGYIVEATIPFSSINFPNQSVMDWRISFYRKTHHVNREIIWPVFSLNRSDFLAQFAIAKNINGIDVGNRLDIIPEFTAIKNDNFNLNENSLDDGPILGELGLNIKYGITSGINLDGTYNPDFSQVEANASKINVNRRSPLFFPEKRIFFLDGTEIFETPIQVLYTRQLVDPLVGAKINGRIGEYSFGLFSVVDEYQGSNAYLKNEATYDNIIPDDMFIDYNSLNVSKYAGKYSLNNIFRIKRNILKNSNIGLMLTDREFEDSYNRIVGLDGQFRISDNWVYQVQGLYSLTRELRPDLQTMEVFTSKEIADHAAYSNLWYGSRTFNFQLLYNDYAPDFRAQNGFIEREDILSDGFREGGIYIWYDFKSQKSSLQLFQPNIYYTRIFNYDGKVIEDNIWPGLRFNFAQKTNISLNYFYSREFFGGINFYKNNYAIDLENDYFSWLKANLYYYFGDEIFYDAGLFGISPFKGDNYFLSSSLTIKPIKTVDINFSLLDYIFAGESEGINFGLRQIIPRLKLSWQINRYFAMRFITEDIETTFKDPAFKAFDSNEIDYNFLISYEPSPGTVFYLGYNDIQQRVPDYSGGWILKDFRRSTRGFFTKFSYLFRF